MGRLLVLFLLSSFLFSTSCAPLTRKILFSDPASLKNTTKLFTTAGKNTTKLLLPAGKNTTKPLLAAGKNTTKLLLAAGKNTTKLLLTAGKNTTKLLLPDGKNTTKLLLPAGKNTTKLLLAAGKNTTKLLLAAGKNQTTLLKSSSKIANSTKLKKPTNSAIAKSSNSTKLKKPTNSTSIPKSPIPSKPISSAWFSEDPLEELDLEEDDSDLIAEFRDLPSRFQETLLPDLAKISSTSKTYLSKASKKITSHVKPIVGRRYAGAVAAAASTAAFILLPILLLAGILRHVRHHLSLQRIILFSQGYLAIYFSVLFLSAMITGLEPLRLFFATSPAVYVGTQMVQAVGYVVFLMLQMVQIGVAPARAAALPQTAAAVAVGLHYYMAVFHRAVEGEPPKTSWKAHGLYAACFLSLFGISSAVSRRKKAYLAGEDDGKTS